VNIQLKKKYEVAKEEMRKHRRSLDISTLEE
jgi:hypothetical protein